MSDNRRVYRRIKTALRQLAPKEITGNQARHLNTLAGMVAGIVQSKRCHYRAIAKKAPDGNKVESRIKKIARYVKNERIDTETYFLPFISYVVAGLAASGPLVLAMDASETGRNCLTLMVSVIYKKRALPLAWLVVKGNKGHLPEEKHLALLTQVKTIVPADSDVIFLGDGEFDGTDLQAEVTAAGWHYACRTAKNRLVCDDGDQFALDDIYLQPGDCIDIPAVGFTQANYGPVMVIAWWREGCKAPLYLVTNFECVDAACYWYQKRFRIETFFSDQKSRGFHLHKSHIADPARIHRLLIAACLAYIWVIYLGVTAIRDEWIAIIHRTDRCDLSLFQLGLDLLEHFLNEGLQIPFDLRMPEPAYKSVR
jgi:hypothetical protein